MGAFNFRLQTVLKLRQQQEQEQENRLGRAIQELELRKRELCRLAEQITDLDLEFNHNTKKTTIHQLVKYNEYSSVLTKQIKQQQVNVNKASTLVDKGREDLMKAVRDRQILEKLKEKQHQEYQLSLQHQEQNGYDELAGFRHQERIAED